MSEQGASLPPVFINKKRYEPTAREMTGAAIKGLAGIGADHELRLLQGDNDHGPGTAITDQQIVTIDHALHFRAVPRDRNYGSAALDE
jgi:hypothetical protein